jgi:peptide/nickel transport system permease protein
MTGQDHIAAPATHWRIVRQRFRRHRLARLGLWLAIGLCLLALLAPLLANDKPLVARWQGRLRFPAFTSYLESWPLPAFVVRPLRKTSFFSDHYSELEGRSWKDAVRASCGVAGEDWRLWHASAQGDWFFMPLVPYGFAEQDPSRLKLRPGDAGLAGTKHWLGTDNLGRDVLARLIHGCVIALAVGVLSVAIYCAIGVVVGSLAGYCGAWVDLAVSRLIEVVICFPSLFLVLALVAALGPSVFNVILVLGLVRWTGPARLIRGEVLRNKTADYIVAARALGLPERRVLFRHLVPNCLAPVLVHASFGVAAAIVIESSLSFLGFGVAPPMASWGEIGRQGRLHVGEGAWHLVLFPGLATFLTVVAFNLVAEGLRDAMDPRHDG